MDYFGNYRSEMLEFLPNHKKYFLDVGCGTGNFGSLIKIRNSDSVVYGIEPNVSAFIEAKEKLDFVVNDTVENGLNELGDKTFDVIILNDVLEHISCPRKVLLSLKGLLNDQGNFIISLPNIRYYPVLFELLFKKDFYYQDSGVLDRTHRTFFTKKSAIRFFQENGLSVIKSKGLNSSMGLKFLFFNIVTFFAFYDTRFLQYGFLLKSVNLNEKQLRSSNCL